MSDEPTELPCVVCDDLSMAVVSGAMITGDSGSFAACPLHIDTAIARLQDEIHTTMETKAGILNDWYLQHHPELAPRPEQQADGEAPSSPVEMQTATDVEARGEAPDGMTITAVAVEQQTEAEAEGD